MPKTFEDVQNIADEHGWCLNPDVKIVKGLIKAQNMLFDKFGEYYCPCKVKRIPENVCPCKDSEEEIANSGHCHCQLFYKCE